MVDKELNVKVIYGEEDCYTRFQELSCQEEPEVKYSVYNLSDCPEDAIIDRALFSANEYIKVLNLGIKLAQKGYTKVVASYEEGEY